MSLFTSFRSLDSALLEFVRFLHTAAAREFDTCKLATGSNTGLTRIIDIESRQTVGKWISCGLRPESPRWRSSYDNTPLPRRVVLPATKPREGDSGTRWFGFYKPGQGKVLQTLQESALYKEDWLGLQAMDKAGKLHFFAADGDHLQFSNEFFVSKIVPFLK